MAGPLPLVRSTLSRYSAALAYPEYRTMWTANLAAQAANWALIVSRGWLAFDLTGSSMAVGVVTFAALAPQLFTPPFAGVLADRMNRRTLMASTYAVNLVATLLLLALVAAGGITDWHLVALSLVNGMARATQMSTSQALAATLVPADKVLNALSLSAATQHASKLVGPGLAAPALGVGGATASFAMCAALFGVGWVQMMRVRVPSPAREERREPFLDSFVAGLRLAWRQPFIRMVLVMVFLHCGLTMAFESLLPNFAAQQLMGSQAAPGGGPMDHDAMVGGFDPEASAFATLLSGVGLGALFGSLLIGGIDSALARGRLYLVMGLLSGLGQAALSFAPNMAVAFLAAAVMGGSQAAFMTMGQATMQALAPNEYRGRIASLNTLSLGGVMSLMNLANGYLGTSFAAATILLVQGLLYTGLMLASVAFATPRSAYTRGLPSRAAPLPVAA